MHFFEDMKTSSTCVNTGWRQTSFPSGYKLHKKAQTWRRHLKQTTCCTTNSCPQLRYCKSLTKRRSHRALAILVDEGRYRVQDLLYEEELLRNPFALKMWYVRRLKGLLIDHLMGLSASPLASGRRWRYLEARRESPASKRYVLYERALKALPGSYKV